MWPHDRSIYQQATRPEPRSGIQREGGIGWREGREDAGRVGAVVWRSRQPDTIWRTQLLEEASRVFGADSGSEAAEPAIDVKTLHAKIGGLTQKYFGG